MQEDKEKTTCSTGTPPKKVPPEECPYCGLRFSNPVEVLQHVFRDHAS